MRLSRQSSTANGPKTIDTGRLPVAESLFLVNNSAKADTLKTYITAEDWPSMTYGY
jgi:hypothetical protein